MKDDLDWNVLVTAREGRQRERQPFLDQWLGRVLPIEFDDPDVVLSIELVGDVGGIGLVTREMRARHPFVRID